MLVIDTFSKATMEAAFMIFNMTASLIILELKKNIS